MIKYSYITIEQPIGCFYIISIKAKDLLPMVGVERRSLSKTGIQRDLQIRRVGEIASYCSDPDATFPTSIIIGINDKDHVHIDYNTNEIWFDEGFIVGSVIDGQHRLAGIAKSDFAEKYELPVVLMFDLTLEEQAYIFSIINGKQAPMNTSLIYDLFELSSVRSPQRTAHEIARAFNKEPESPFYNRLKMLGRRMPNQEVALISQGFFAESLVKQILKNSEKGFRPHQLEGMDRVKGMPLRDMYLDNEDNIIYKVMFNCFSALRELFPEYWETPSSNILWKTSGFGGVMKALPELVLFGIYKNSISQSFFKMCFTNFKTYLTTKGVSLTNDYFPGGGDQVQSRVAKYILEANGL